MSDDLDGLRELVRWLRERLGSDVDDAEELDPRLVERLPQSTPIQETLVESVRVLPESPSANKLWSVAGQVYAVVEETLEDPVTDIQGVGDKRADQLSNLDVETIGDLLFHLPRTYLDRRYLDTIRDLEPDERVSVFGEVVSKQVHHGRNPRLQVRMTDDTGVLTVLFWNQPYLDNQISRGDQLFCSGEVETYQGRPQLNNPDFERIEAEDDLEEQQGIKPVYPLTEGLTQGYLRRWVRRALDRYEGLLLDPLPPDLRGQHELPTRETSLESLHFPADHETLKAARRRMKLEEFLLYQLVIEARRSRRQQHDKGRRYPESGYREEFLEELPFELTGDQQTALGEIEQDLASSAPMHRLLQGDVGTGKTAVAVASMVRVWENDYQVALMAPTEVLARQHHQTVQELLEPVGIEPELLVGQLKGSIQQAVRERIAAGETRFVVGTHGLIQEATEFDNLGYAVVDEQHRFGVRQRRELRESGTAVDLLVMSATPIPRSLSLTVHGDLEVSTLREFPGGPRTVRTVLRKQTDSYRNKLYDRLRTRAEEGEKSFLLFPAIEESDELDLLSAEACHEQALREGWFGTAGVGLLHGRMEPDEVQAVMERFRAGDIRVLFCTTVVEVGVDVPDASIMVVHNAERFGLAQLHQLRGRIGRAGQDASCVLLMDPEAPEESRDRLAVLEETDDGFEVAVQDRLNRGPGDLMGTDQAGVPDFRLGDPWRDRELMETARELAEELLVGELNGEGSAVDHPILRRELDRYRSTREVNLHTG